MRSPGQRVRLSASPGVNAHKGPTLMYQGIRAIGVLNGTSIGFKICGLRNPGLIIGLPSP
jgi:hypothetical protein